uniref:Zgc:158868 n=1 Tax=Myripristis murdjan TaxID=586833 RepID=A0A667ZKR4_9TELE
MSVRLGGNILVTGSNRGIGLELVKQLLDNTGQEDHIYACCREPEGAGAEVRLSTPPQVTIVQLDTSDEDSVTAAVQVVGERVTASGLNLLINNAAINKPASPALLSATSKADMMEVFETNVAGPFLLAKFHLLFCFCGQMSCRRSAIINMSTLVSSIEKCPQNFHIVQMYPYRTSKAALNMLTRCLAEDFRKHSILVTGVHPGWVITDMGGKEAPMTPQQSVLGMLSMMSSLSDKDSGKLVDWMGNQIPW